MESKTPAFILVTARYRDGVTENFVPTLINTQAIVSLENRDGKTQLFVYGNGRIEIECVEPYQVIKDRIEGKRSNKGFWDVIDSLLVRIFPKRHL